MLSISQVKNDLAKFYANAGSCKTAFTCSFPDF